jgi:hypothetical protein
MITAPAPPKVSIGQVVRRAIVFNFRNWRGGPVNADPLPAAVTRLFTLLDERRIDYALVGGIALLQYVEGRNTEDIDLILAAPLWRVCRKSSWPILSMRPT